MLITLIGELIAIVLIFVVFKQYHQIQSLTKVIIELDKVMGKYTPQPSTEPKDKFCMACGTVVK